MFDAGKSHYKAIVDRRNKEKNIEIRHKLLSYLNLSEAPSSEVEHKCSESELKTALINAEKNTEEMKVMMTEMQQKMVAFDAELFTVKNQNYLLNAELTLFNCFFESYVIC